MEAHKVPVFLDQIGIFLEGNMELVEMPFNADIEHAQACYQNVEGGKRLGEHKAYGCAREKLTCALEECYLVLFCRQEVITATVSQMGLLCLLVDCGYLVAKYFS